eukprot:TRINITY_DN440_c0_g1_i3.p1 TRINITY_DN440_c0_g1~~TRINITY_DN440_c0_g1_i3.p1  ORF type:complete len:846 (+),score=250.69 TRINITY_DN440_c0_g1_i3:274-2811(+)
MHLGRAGEAYFIEPSEGAESPTTAASPSSSPTTTRRIEQDSSAPKAKFHIVATQLEEIDQPINLSASAPVAISPSKRDTPTSHVIVGPSLSASTPSEPIHITQIVEKKTTIDVVTPLEGSPIGSLAEKLEEVANPAEVSWRWGSLPSFSRKPSKPDLAKDDTDIVYQAKDKVPAKDVPGRWGKVASMFRIFKGNAATDTKLTKSKSATAPPGQSIFEVFSDEDRDVATFAKEEKQAEDKLSEKETAKEETSKEGIISGEVTIFKGEDITASPNSSNLDTSVSEPDSVSLPEVPVITAEKITIEYEGKVIIQEEVVNNHVKKTVLEDSASQIEDDARSLDSSFRGEEEEEDDDSGESYSSAHSSPLSSPLSLSDDEFKGDEAPSDEEKEEVAAMARKKKAEATSQAISLTATSLSNITFQNIGNINMSISKCGNLIGPSLLQQFTTKDFDDKEINRIFQENLVSFEDLSKNPELIFDQTLLFKIKERIYPWSIAGPVIVSLLVFRRPLDYSVIEKLELHYTDKTSKEAQKLAAAKKGWGSYLWWRNSSNAPKGKSTDPKLKDSAENPATSPKATSELTAQLKAKESLQQKSAVKKSVRPTSDILNSFNLKPGPNTIKFSVSSPFQGTREVRATIYLWEPDCKIVISDIDGTITKSDVFGQILPIMGRDWSHSGVVHLYSNIKANNYHMLYLTSRPIGSANLTRGYISSLKQQDILMPQGPLFMSPNRLLSSFNQEVILRRPEEFKIACLKDIKSLFPPGSQVFYAGFGNRPTDALSYRTVGVPLGKIFTINYKGEISIVNYTYRKTFSTLNELVNNMFPVRVSGQTDEEYNQWNFWKQPLPKLQNL